MSSSSSTGGKCTQQVELSGENINITYKPDGTHVAVGNRVLSRAPYLYTFIVLTVYGLLDRSLFIVVVLSLTGQCRMMSLQFWMSVSLNLYTGANSIMR